MQRHAEDWGRRTSGSIWGLGAERKEGQVAEEDFVIFTRQFKARNERTGELPEAQALPLAAYSDAQPHLPGWPSTLWYQQEQQTDGRGLCVYFETSWGKWVSGDAVPLGRHLRAGDGTSTIFSPILQVKKRTQRSHLLKVI